MMANASLPNAFEIGSTTVSAIAAPSAASTRVASGKEHPQAALSGERLRRLKRRFSRASGGGASVGRVEFGSVSRFAGAFPSLFRSDSGPGSRRERVVDVPEDIIKGLQADGDAGSCRG